MEPEFHVEQAFWTPVVVNHFHDAELNGELEGLILARRDADAGAHRSNVGGWQSDKELLEWGGEPMRRLVDHVKRVADANTSDIRGDAGRARGWWTESWATVSDEGAYIASHIHGGCYWSGVYYVRVDEGEGGELVLHDPRLPELDMHAPHLRFRHSAGERAIRSRPVAGRLILFPGWLAHSVNPWRSRGLRISVVINLAAQRGAPDGAG